MLASAFQNYPIWAYIQPREDLRRKLLTWVLKRYMRGILAKSKLRQGCVYAVRDGADDSLAGVILLWRPSTAGEVACLACYIYTPWRVRREEARLLWQYLLPVCQRAEAECLHQHLCILL